MPKLSIVIPAYNESRYVRTLLEKVLAVPVEKLGFTKEVVFVDDGSTDGTLELAQSFQAVRCFRQSPNGGKGKAVQRGIAESTGDYILVQDADLEYDPMDYLEMLKCLTSHPGTAVYGSRTLGSKVFQQAGFLAKWKGQGWGPWLAGKVLTWITYLLYGKWISDTLTAYKIYPASAIRKMKVVTSGFETDHEITAKLIRGSVGIVEVPIHYEPRSLEEGKKIRWQDGVVAIVTLLKFRVLN